MSKIKVVGLMLRWARESAKISIDTISKKIQKTPEIIKSWEDEKDSPTYAQLEDLARIYKRPLALFFFPEPPEEPDLKKSFRTLPDFELERLETSTLFRIRKAKIMQFNLKELCNEKNPAAHNIVKEFFININDNPQKIAQDLRNYLNIPLEEQISWKNSSKAFKNWRNILYEFGIFIFQESFEQEDISGFCLFDKEFPIIYVNSSQFDNRKIFTLFHELGHLLTGINGIDIKNDEFIEVLSKKDWNWKIEYLCNQLTGSVLVPDKDFDKKLDQRFEINEEFIEELSKLYSVSREVILRKIKDRGKVSEEEFNAYLKRWKQQIAETKRIKEEKRKKEEKTGGPDYYFTKAAYLGPQYIDLVFNKYYQEQINISDVAEYLNIKVKNVPKFEDKVILKI